MIVRIARVKVGNRQAPYAVRPEPRSLRKSAGVLAFARHSQDEKSRPVGGFFALKPETTAEPVTCPLQTEPVGF